MNDNAAKIIWVDDEIDLLKPHILFLEKKGYEVMPVRSGNDALEKINVQSFDLVLLDENMPGLSGLQTLQEIKKTHADLPVVMVTKSEAENIMDEAIGAHIADYLIKPINPNQILLSLKKLLHKKSIIQNHTTRHYQETFRTIALEITQAKSYKDWEVLYKKLV